MKAQRVQLWGAADLRKFSTLPNQTGKEFPIAISFAIPMNPEIMLSIQSGPNRKCAGEYAAVNNRINEVSTALSDEARNRGFQSEALPALVRTDTVNIKGDFPQKTAATRAGLRWIGRHCQLITRRYGQWVRLGTVFTCFALPCGPPIEKNNCLNLIMEK